MEDEKVLNLVEKMFNVFTDKIDHLEQTINARFEQIDKRFDQMDARLDKMDARMDKMDTHMDNLEASINKTNLIIENVIAPKLNALFDGYTQHTEQINRLEEKLDNLQADVTFLSIKTLNQDTKITELSRRVK